MIGKGINFVRGVVRVTITGAFVERFLNICAARGVAFWQVERIDDAQIKASLNIDGYREMRKYAKKACCKIKIEKKQGVPFAINRYLPRVGLWGGFLCCAVLIFFMATRVWTFSIDGQTHFTDGEIMGIVKQAGVGIGSRKSDIHSESMQTQILLNVPELSFFAINIQGSHAEIVVRERTPVPEIFPADEPCNIVSDKDGIVEKIEVQVGERAVERGHSVIAGDLLVSGSLQSTQGDFWNVHSTANIVLRTWHKYTAVMPRTWQSKEMTGKTHTRYSLVFGNTRIKLYLLEKSPYLWYDKKYKKQLLKLGDGMVLPVGIISEEYLEYEPTPMSVESTSDMYVQKLKENFQKELLDIEIVNENTSIVENGNFIVGEYTVECLEKAGIKIAMEGN